MIKGIGIDICDIVKLKAAIKRNKRFPGRVFSPEEISYCSGKKHSILHFAGRFAAKEAFIKAVATDKTLALNRIEIINDRHGKPGILLNKKIRALLKKKKATKFSLSITHTNSAAAAVCVIT
jgi:holo-[acyl-carrier protein] synthase